MSLNMNRLLSFVFGFVGGVLLANNPLFINVLFSVLTSIIGGLFVIIALILVLSYLFFS